MTSLIRRRIAQRVYELCKSNVICPDHLEKEIKSNIKVSRRHSPIELQLQATGNFEIEANEGLINSFKGDESIDDVKYDEKHQRFLFSVKPLILAQKLIKNILENEEFWKTNCCLQLQKPEKIVVEFSSPNIAKPFHAGHLRSTVLGNFITRINQAMGHQVISLNYLGDWGYQFALLNVGYKLMGSPDELIRDPIGHLYKVYIAVNDVAQNSNILAKAREYVNKLENNDEKAMKKWKQFRDLSVTHLQETYERLGINFTEYHGESMYRESHIRDVLQNLKDLGLLINVGGAQVVETGYSQTKNHVVLVKQDGSTVYLSRDLAAAIDRFEKYQFDRMYYVVENGQHDHFKALFHIIKRMKKPWHENVDHIKFGRIQKMSTRKGTVVFLKDILEEAKSRTLESMKQSPNTKVRGDWEKVADILGTSAVLINSMKYPRMRNYDFDWDKILTTKATSGIQLQYCHARLCNLRTNCGIQLQDDYDVNLLEEPEALQLIHCLSRYEEVLEVSHRDLEPSHLVLYLFTLSKSINVALTILTVKNEESSKAQARLALFTASQIVLNHALKLVGVRPLNEM
uniref:Probable arginine--tRNA ligase, mitochondrial n=1 Tax=Strigamia maritima TaxID=126957 RepID=T1IUB1_STRMM